MKTTRRGKELKVHTVVQFEFYLSWTTSSISK